ncbi:hypothetical protein [Fodinicola acaciae]|uniref:hypothetical protein n=1 Tax=Fodinicola acaciae TaxID=2681555 RepID=UPI0013CFC6EB|nr:hypothetical protein [Fodinicola acaciae]
MDQTTTAVFGEPATADGFLPILDDLGIDHQSRPLTDLSTVDLSAHRAVIVLADGYRQAAPAPTTIGHQVAEFVRAGGRAYVEYATGPGLPTAGEPRPSGVERIFVTDKEVAGFEALTLFDEHQSWLLPVTAPENATELLSYGRVAGVYSAVFGPPDESLPALLEIPLGSGSLLFATTALSNFQHGHYRLAARWRQLVRGLLASLHGIDAPPVVRVRTSPREWAASGTPVRILVSSPQPVTSDVPLTEVAPGEWQSAELNLPDGEHVFAVGKENVRIQVSPREQRYRRMLDRCVEWYDRAGMFFDRPDGSAGIAEGFMSEVQPDGEHPFRSVRRGDCYVENAYAFRLYAELSGDKRYRTIGDNLLRLVRDRMQVLDRTAVYGAWETREYWKTLVEMDNLFSDDDGWISAFVLADGIQRADDSAVSQGLRGVESLMRTADAEFGLQVNPWRTPSYLIGHGWDEIPTLPLTDNLDVSAHWQSAPHVAYLFAYAATGDQRYLDIAIRGLDHMAAEFPRMRLETSRTTEYIRFLLPLLGAYHYTGKYRDVIMRIADFLMERRDPESGALAEWDGRNPTSNFAYGLDEQSIVQQNGDPITDQLYTLGFAAWTLPIAHQLTGEPVFDELATGVLDYLSRIQIDDDSPLSGAWMRSFDFANWEYFGSNADIGWGPYCVETGWANATILLGAMIKLTGHTFFPAVEKRPGLPEKVVSEFESIAHPTALPEGPAAAGSQVVASRLLNVVQVFWRGDDDLVRQTYVDQRAGAGPWSQFDEQLVAGNPVAVDNPATGAVEIYARSTENRLVHAYVHAETGRGPWRSLGDVEFVGDPAVVYDVTAAEVEIYVLGVDGHVYHRSALDLRHGYTPWERIRPVTFSAPPAVAYNRTTGRTEIYAIDEAGQLRRTFKINRDHGGWLLAGATLATAVPVHHDGAVRIYGLDTDGHVHCGQFGGSWRSLESPAFVGLRAVETPDGVDVVGRTADGKLHLLRENTWRPVGESAADPVLIFHPGSKVSELYTVIDGRLVLQGVQTL